MIQFPGQHQFVLCLRKRGLFKSVSRPRWMIFVLLFQSEHIRTIIKARGISWQQVAGAGTPTTFAVFRVDAKHHLVSLASKLAPSPDWIVGVSALELCNANCTWRRSITLPLYPYDAGTDSGLNFTVSFTIFYDYLFVVTSSHLAVLTSFIQVCLGLKKIYACSYSWEQINKKQKEGEARRCHVLVVRRTIMIFFYFFYHIISTSQYRPLMIH